MIAGSSPQFRRLKIIGATVLAILALPFVVVALLGSLNQARR